MTTQMTLGARAKGMTLARLMMYRSPRELLRNGQCSNRSQHRSGNTLSILFGTALALFPIEFLNGNSQAVFGVSITTKTNEETPRVRREVCLEPNLNGT
jgi:hypothetical protein